MPLHAWSQTDNDRNIYTNNTISPPTTLPQHRQRGLLWTLWDDSAKLDKQLLQAAEEGELHRVRYLLNSSADVDFTSDLGETALHFAVRRGRKDVVEALILAGANVSHGVRDDYYPVLRHATRSKNEDIACMLIAAGAKLSPMTLHRAASGGLLGIVQALVSAGANVEAGVCSRKNTVSLLEQQLAELRRRPLVDAEHSPSKLAGVPAARYEVIKHRDEILSTYWRFQRRSLATGGL